jgi:hypothetical protein
MGRNLFYDAFTDRINLLCHKIEHYHFLTIDDQQKLEDELKELVEKRAKLLETLEK